ncbi:PQQ-binding-like beta-propeller repeat protein [Nonomuraea longicatena]|uniref:Pyrrolo-quinoline quinone repeat domain-containing protein n=1 Tax=Nonomuraea longicatena TaxID=83682 RepID=A0ABN1Q8D9_9ACTN
MSHPPLPPQGHRPPDPHHRPHGMHGPPGNHPGSPPGYPGPPGDPGRPPGRRRTALILAAAAFAVVLVVGLGTVLHLNGSFRGGDQETRQAAQKTSASPSSSTTAPTSAPPFAKSEAEPPARANVAARELFRVPQPVKNGDDSIASDGSWATDSLYISGGEGDVRAYHATTGKKAWTVDLTGTICEASPGITTEGLIAVLSTKKPGKNAHCTQLTVIDVDEGRKLWTATTPGEHQSRGWGTSVAVTDALVAVGWEHRAVVYQAGTGRQLTVAEAGCDNRTFAGQERMLSVAVCGKEVVLHDHSPETGKPTQTITLPPQVTNARIVSTDPLVLATMTKLPFLDAEKYMTMKVDQLMVLTREGRVQATVDVATGYEIGCDERDTVCDQAVVTDDTVYTVTAVESLTRANRVVAFDLVTGRRKWSAVSDTGTDRKATKHRLVPIRAENDALLAYLTSTFRAKSEVVRFGPDGRRETLLRMPDTREINDTQVNMASSSGVRETPRFVNGRLYLHMRRSFWWHLTDPVMTLAFGPR